MKAVRIDGMTPGGERQKLSSLIPLKTPFSVQIFPIYACNLACDYCIHSVKKEDRGYITDKGLLDIATFKKFVDDAVGFPEQLKMLRFAGTGEPLLHPNINEMIAYAKGKQIAKSIDIVTNGVALSKEKSLSLVAAGVDRIRISVQGLNDLAYSYLGKDGFFSEFVKNLDFLYNHKKNAKIYVKIIDCALNVGDEEKFLTIFGDICDYIAIEHLIPAVDKIDYTQLSNGAGKLTQNGNGVKNIQVCPQPFYMMQLNPDGNMVPCCSMETAIVLGNVEHESVVDIWNGERNREFLRNQLSLKKSLYPVCAKCQQYKYAVFDEDILDYDREIILSKY